MAQIPEPDINLVHQDTRTRLSGALEEASRYKAMAQQLLDIMDKLETENERLKAAALTPDDIPGE